MSVIRQANLLGQQRVDVTHVRGIESSIAGDFDVLAGMVMAGGTPLVVSGFTVTNGTSGSPATSLQLVTAGATILHPQASENGTIFNVPTTRAPETLNAANTRVQGSFTASTANYIGVDLRRSADATTADLVQFINADTNAETPKTVPLARTLDYVIVISTQDFSSMPGIAPVAIVTTDAFNNVASVTYNAVNYPNIVDARSLAFRLGSGGTVPNYQNAYSWPGGRTEVGNNTDFGGGDRAITSLKSWMDAIMSRIWEIGGGQTWYGATADRNVIMTRTGSTFTNGEWFSWDGTNLLWQGLAFAFANSAAKTNSINNQTTSSAGLTNLADGDCIYVDVNRATDGAALQPVKAARVSLGAPTVPGSRYIIAWRVGSNVYTRDSSFPVGSTFFAATTSSMGIAKLHQASLTPTTPVVLTDGDLNTATGVVGLDANKTATIASTSGTALTLTGSGSGSGVLAQAGSTGTAVVAKNSAAANIAPVLVAQDSAGVRRAGYDHIGFPGGVYGEMRESWIDFASSSTTGALTRFANYPRWTYYLSAGGGSILQNASGGTFGSFMWLAPPASGRCTVALTSSLCLNFGSNTAWVLNMPVIIGAQSAGVAGASFVLGANNAGATSDNWVTDVASGTGVFFRKLSTDTNWQTVTVASGTATVNNSGVAVTQNTIYYLRMEFHGSNTAVGVAAGGNVVKFYINGSLVASHTTNIPGGGGGPGFTNLYITNTQDLQVGPMHLAWSHTITPPNV